MTDRDTPRPAPRKRYCVRGDGRPVCPPSKVLCKECLKKLDAKFEALAASLEAQ